MIQHFHKQCHKFGKLGIKLAVCTNKNIDIISQFSLTPIQCLYKLKSKVTLGDNLSVTCPKHRESMSICCLAVPSIQTISWRMCRSIWPPKTVSLRKHSHKLASMAYSVARARGSPVSWQPSCKFLELGAGT